jgi:hypothetical protein
MTIVQKVGSFYRCLSWKLDSGYTKRNYETGGIETIYFSTGRSLAPDPTDPLHSMFFARAAAGETGLPIWLSDIAEREFPCSCEIFDGYEKFVRAAIAGATARGDHEDAQHLRDHLDGFWDIELREAIEEVCSDDSEARTVVLHRFTKWRESGKRQSAGSLWDFLEEIDDILLVSVAREAQRRRRDFNYKLSQTKTHDTSSPKTCNEAGSGESKTEMPF